MLHRFSVNFTIFSILLDMGTSFLAFLGAFHLRPLLIGLPGLVPVTVLDLQQNSPSFLYLVFPILWVFTFLVASVYDPKRIYKAVDELQTVVVASGIASLILAGILYLFFREFSRWLFATYIVINLFSLLSWRILVRIIYRAYRLPSKIRHVLVIGAGDVGCRIGNMIESNQWSGLRLVGYLDDNPQKRGNSLPILGDLKEVREVVKSHQVDDVVIALPQRAYGKVNQLALTLHDLPVNVRVVPDYFSLALYRASVEDFGGVPMINLRDPALNEVQRLVKRLFDLVLGSILMIFALPIIIVMAILIRFDSSGPVVFRQPRVGENGRVFYMFKFRTMINGADAIQENFNKLNESGQIIFKKRDDPRITKVGRTLRRTSLDELPQLFNVLKGEMSLVGPRPELPWMVNHYEPWQHKRFAVPQGMTGWWQVNGRSDKPMHLFTDDDIFYVQNYSIWMDLYILLKTPWVVFRGKGAY